jgi:lipopolysaccharide/colanic/teichoic acid biosynthesis glycosyltransferase
MYAKCIKRILDFSLSLIAVLILSPLFLLLILSGTLAMGGNPFFTQLRPGMVDKKTGKEKIFKLVKFRTMSNKKDKDGNLLPDEDRLNRYGRILRSTSLDELPELWNISKGDVSIVGPRPPLVEYLPYYTETERHRHDVRPGLTGWAQVNGRNAISWDLKLAYDVEYLSKVTLMNDIRILFLTVQKVLKRSDIQVGDEFQGGKFIDQRQERVHNAILEGEVTVQNAYK